MDLVDVQTSFNELFNFEDLKSMGYRYIHKKLLEGDTGLLEKDCIENSISYKDLKIAYKKTAILINEMVENGYPIRLLFAIDDEDIYMPNYIYELKYNSDGKLMSECIYGYLIPYEEEHILLDRRLS